MVKETIQVEIDADMENPSEWMDRLRDALKQVPFLKIHPIEMNSVAQGGLPISTKLRLEIHKEPWTILVEISKNGEPLRVRMAAEQLRHAMKNYPGKVYGVLMAPFLSNASREILKGEGLGWLDWAGNSFLSFSSIHIQMERSQSNPFKTRRQQVSLFAPKSAQLLRLFLTQPGPWKVESMAKRAGVSLGQVSKVRKLLLEREYGAIDPAGGLILKNGNALLDAWRAVAKPPQVRMRAYTALHGPALEMKLAELFGLRTGPGSYVLASHSVARRIAPFARMSGEMFYADSVGQAILKRTLDLSPVDQGENITIYAPPDARMWDEAIELPGGLRGAGLVQTYLDLCSAGERSSEAGDHLRREKIAPMIEGVMGGTAKRD